MSIDPIMQAAERLRLLEASNDYRTAYGDAPAGLDDFEAEAHWMTLEDRDRDTLADHYLSILPKGRRPVAIEVADCKSRDLVSGFVPMVSGDICEMECVCQVCRRMVGLSTDRPAYTTEADAILASRWMMIDELSAR